MFSCPIIFIKSSRHRRRKRPRWTEADLKTRSRWDPEKVTLAARLRAETTLTVRWIAERLSMGTRGYLNQLVYRKRKIGGK